MKAKRIFRLALLVFTLIAASLSAQNDPFGNMDTLGVELCSCPRGAKTQVEVYLFNDEELFGLSVPLRFPTQYLNCDTILFEGTKLEGTGLFASTIDNDSGFVLFGGVVMNGEPISQGRGVLARLVFSVSADAPEGMEITIDTGFVPPAGDFVLTGAGAAEIFPVFNAGILTVTSANLPPVFKPVQKQYIVEGETLEFAVEAYDRERDEFEISAARLPDGAVFNSETGLFSWTPPYVGSGSSVGNPYLVIFTAADGISADHMQVEIEVINKNRAPELIVADSVGADAGDLIEILIEAEDPDFEKVTIEIDNLPGQAWYDGQNPGLIHWESSLADSGDYNIQIGASDPNGSHVSEELNLRLNSVSACELEIESAQTYVGETVVVAVKLSNHVKLKSMQLLMKYDPTALELISFTNVGTRTQNWESFLVEQDEFAGKIWLTGEADIPAGDPIEPMPVGDGNIFLMNLRATSDMNFVGLYIPVQFEFMDTLTYSDNTFTDDADQFIGQDQVSYTDGSVFIKMYEGVIGDINLNGIAFEISDVVYFTNYFIDPNAYPLDGARWPNSDVNQDGRPGTVGDLVYLIRIITGDIGSSAKLEWAQHPLSCILQSRFEDDRLTIDADWEGELGGALFSFACGDTEPFVYQTERTAHLDLFSKFENGILTVLICDPEGRPILSGNEPLVEIGAPESDGIYLESAELADVYGNHIMARIVSGEAVPEQFELGQNYPNPFNPITTIEFGLPKEGEVSLKIFNIRGQLVRTILDEYREAGYHRLQWDGTNGQGEKISSGVYFYRLKFDGMTATRKMIMLK